MLVFGGGLACLICIIVMLGWQLGLEPAVRLRADFSPMQFNTAFAMGLVAAGLVLDSLRYRLPAGLFAVGGWLIASATLAQYWLDMDLGIDELFHNHQFGETGAAPGRMSPNSAFTIALLAAAVFLRNMAFAPHTSRWLRHAALLAAVLATASLLISVVGYLIGASEVFGFVEETRMGIFKTAAAIAIAIPVGYDLLMRNLRNEVIPANIILITAALGVAFMLASAALAMREQARHLHQRQLQVELQYIGAQLGVAMNSRVSAMERMAGRWGRMGGVSEPIWRADAARFTQDDPAVQAVSWVTPAGRVTWVEPEAGNEAAIGLDVLATADRRGTFERARNGQTTVATPLVELVQGGRGFVTMSPIFLSGGEFDGMMNAVFVLSALLESVPESPELDRNHLVMARGTDGLVLHAPFSLAGQEAHVGVDEAGYADLAPDYMVSNLTLVMGLLAGGLALLALSALLESTQQRRIIARANEKLREANAELDSFAYMASHDLKSPMRGIRQLADWLEQDLASQLSGDARRYLDLLHSRIGRLQDLTDSLLEFSRVGRNAIKPTAVELLDEVRDAIALLERPQGWMVEVSGDPGTAMVDRNLVLVVVSNLVNNAIKHHDLDAGQIDVSVVRTITSWRLRVADDGPGIPVDMHDRVFGMFQTLKPKDVTEGSGMGLAIVAKAVSRLGGSIHLQSDPDQARGCVFIVDIPHERGGPDAP